MKLTREQIQTIAANSNWKDRQIRKRLQSDVYANEKKWKSFIKYFLLGCGASFVLSGIICFFAYNWDDLHKFAKLALIGGTICLLVFTYFLWIKEEFLRKIIISSLCILTGVLFAVFGQIYQTGANAYDFFLGWTLFTALWVLVANFLPLWLIFIALVNTTAILYAGQVACVWNDPFVYALLFLFNGTIVAGLEFFYFKKYVVQNITWFRRIIAIGAVVSLTLDLLMVILETRDDDQWGTFLGLLFFGTCYPFAWKYFTKKNLDLVIVAIIPFSIIIIVSAFILETMSGDDMAALFVVSIFILLAVTFVVYKLRQLQKMLK